MSLTHLLAFLLSIVSAHAAPTEISLHNDATLHESSVVSNWTLLCEHLCSLNLSGPGCVGLEECPSTTSSPVDNEEYLAQSEHREELCDTLCENGLGVNQCDCKLSIVPFSSPRSSMKPDKRKICYDFCRFRQVTLKGCSPCSSYSLFEYERELKFNYHDDFYVIPPPPPPPPHMFPHPIVTSISTNTLLPLAPNAHKFVGLSLQAATTDATTIQTTPDWTRLCVQLCRNGSGGILCNCDLSPF